MHRHKDIHTIEIHTHLGIHLQTHSGTHTHTHSHAHIRPMEARIASNMVRLRFKPLCICHKIQWDIAQQNTHHVIVYVYVFVRLCLDSARVNVCVLLHVFVKLC